MFLRLPNLASVPSELRRFFEDFKAWAKERERFERSITTEGTFPTVSKRTALKQGVVVRETRVSEGTAGSSVSLSGSLIPDVNNTYDLGSSTFRWRDLFLGRNADIDGTLDVAGNVNFASGLTVSGRASFVGMSVSGDIMAVNAAALHQIYGRINGYSFFQIASDGSTVDFSANDGVLIGLKGLTCAGQLDSSGIHSLAGTVVVDGAFGVTGAAEFRGGVSISTGFTFTGQVATLQNLTVSDGLTGTHGTFSGNVRIDGVLGVTGTALLSGGLSTSVGVSLGSAWVTGLSAVGGVTFEGSVQLSPNAISAGRGITGRVVPLTTLIHDLGATGRRWANVWGGTLTLTNAATAGGTLTISGDHNHKICSSAGIAQTYVGNSLYVEGQFFVGGGAQGDISPTLDDTYGLGNETSRWSSLFLSGIAVNAMGATITAGTTIAVLGGGNYYHISGVSDIVGISTADIRLASAYQPGTRILFNLNSNPTFVHSSRIILSGAVNYVGTTAGMIEFVSEGADNWREVGRRV